MLTPAELAAELRISERTVARMVLDGCPSFMVGRRRRFDLATVTVWTQEREKSCRFAATPVVVGTPKSVSAANAFIDASKKVQFRVMPRNSKLT